MTETSEIKKQEPTIALEPVGTSQAGASATKDQISEMRAGSDRLVAGPEQVSEINAGRNANANLDLESEESPSAKLETSEDLSSEAGSGQNRNLNSGLGSVANTPASGPETGAKDAHMQTGDGQNRLFGHGAGTPVEANAAGGHVIARHDVTGINNALELIASGQVRLS